MGDKTAGAVVTAVGCVIGIVLAGTVGPWIPAAIGAMAIATAAAIAIPTAMGPGVLRCTLWTTAGTAGAGSAAILAHNGLPIAGAALALTFAVAGGVAADHVRKTADKTKPK